MTLEETINFIKKGSYSELEDIDLVEMVDFLEELEVYKKALKIACSGENTNPICATEEYKACCMSFGSCGECWENVYLHKARLEE